MIEPHYADDWLTIYQGDCRAVMAELEPESVNCVVTSPPYWGLRDYGLPPSVWGDRSDPLTHAHEWTALPTERETRGPAASTLEGSFNEAGRFDRSRGALCGCGAWLGCLGLEPRPEAFVAHLVEVFAVLRRVLRKDGTVWLNLGDSYADRANRRSDGETFRRDRADVVPPKHNTIGGAWAFKAKDRMMIPARVAIALQADGWWIRDEIVWHKPNPMPSSVADRTTPAHEMIYLLTRSARYAYDADAIREPIAASSIQRINQASFDDQTGGPKDYAHGTNPNRSARKGLENFAKGRRTPAGWNVNHDEPNTVGRYAQRRDKTADAPNARGLRQAPEPGEADAFHPLGRNKRSVWTIPTEPYPDAHFATFPRRLIEPMILAGCPAGGVVLDPFAGSGTTGLVAQALGRRAVLIDLSGDYLEQAVRRTSRQFGVGGPELRDDGTSTPPEGSLWAEVTPEAAS